MTDDQTPWMRLLRELFGDDAEEALEELQRMGLDPQALAQASGMGASPAMMDHVLRQRAQNMDVTSTTPVIPAAPAD